MGEVIPNKFDDTIYMGYQVGLDFVVETPGKI